MDPGEKLLGSWEKEGTDRRLAAASATCALSERVRDIPTACGTTSQDPVHGLGAGVRVLRSQRRSPTLEKELILFQPLIYSQLLIDLCITGGIP